MVLIKLLKPLCALLLASVILPANANSTNTTLTVEEQSVVTLDALQFALPTAAQYRWIQTRGNQVRLQKADSATATFNTPAYAPDGDNQLEIILVTTTATAYKAKYTTTTNVIPSQPKTPPVLVAQRNQNEFLIEGKYHPLGNELVAVIHFPEGASADNPVPGCAIVHGSGGLFRENDPGQSCSQQLESNYQLLNNQLIAKGIATILPSSFYSRDERFCEDNDSDYLEFATAPFFNGNDPIQRDSEYKNRRVAIRAMDMLATMRFFCDLDQVDCEQACMVGTSNGGTSIMSYTAQSITDDLSAFMDDDKRPFESNSAHDKRTDAFANFPPLTVSPITLKYQLTHRPLPSFAQLISPGCTMRDIVPDIEPGEENLPFALNELFYPAGDTQLTFEVGTDDGVPDECYQGGFREIQARYFEQQSGINANDSQYMIQVHPEGEHNLLDDDEPHRAEVLERLDNLVDEHFLP
ncbi:MAG: alpha/beta hydrolase [Algicola sp.]|nr:alpha/beta hydrolase [Algicola sp.]